MLRLYMEQIRFNERKHLPFNEISSCSPSTLGKKSDYIKTHKINMTWLYKKLILIYLHNRVLYRELSLFKLLIKKKM